jgi:hypothetical protein
MDVPAFERELQRYENSRLNAYVYPRATVSEVDISVTRLGESADELLPLYARARLPVRREDTAELAERMRRAAGAHQDLYARKALAYAHMLVSDHQAGRDLLAAMVAADASDAEAHYMTGLSYFLEANEGAPENWAATAARGRRHFARASRLTPHHVPTLYFYAKTFSREPTGMPEGALDVLVQAYLYAPQVAPIRLDAAQYLMQAGEFDVAIPILRPIAFSPHGGEMAQYAQRLLAAAERGEMPAPPEEESAAEASN